MGDTENPRAHFAVELAAFDSKKAAWLAAGADGKWVVLKGDRDLGPFPDYPSAWRAGIEAFGVPGFMVRQIVAHERPLVVSHVCWHPHGDRAG
jgi:hypothetical protein